MCEGDDETAVAKTGAEVRAACSTVWNFRINGRAVDFVMNAFTCTGAYAILILYGVKRTENRNMLPEPREGRAAISCSKSFCKEEYGRLIAWASGNLPPEDFEKLPSWREVKDWPGKIVGVCDYKVRDGLNLVLEDGVYKSKPTPKQEWDEGYPYWWDLSNVRRLAEPIPCRGNVGMWQLSESLAAKVEAVVHLNHPC